MSRPGIEADMARLAVMDAVVVAVGWVVGRRRRRRRRRDVSPAPGWSGEETV